MEGWTVNKRSMESQDKAEKDEKDMWKLFRKGLKKRFLLTLDC